VWRLVTTATATFFLFGKFVILGGSDGDLFEACSFFTAEQLVVLVLYLDVTTACVLAFHWGFIFRLPVVGRRLYVLVEDGVVHLLRQMLQGPAIVGLPAGARWARDIVQAVVEATVAQSRGVGRPLLEPAFPILAEQRRQDDILLAGPGRPR
jgi:hypothetical protein